MWLQLQGVVISRHVAMQSSPKLGLWQHGGRGRQRYSSRRSSSSHTTTTTGTTLSVTLAREHQQQRLLLLLTTRTRGRRFSVHHAETAAGGSKHRIKQQPEELSKLLLEHPAALQTYLEKLTLQQRSEIHHLLRQEPSAAAASTATAAATVPEPSRHDLRLVAINTAIPFVGFGIMDNSILIIAGDAIDTTLGVALGISTMCAAAIGNIISDVAGVLLGTFVEDFTQKYLSVPSPVLSDAQRKLRSVRWASQAGCAIGLVIGCIIGMFPLAFMDSKKIQHDKRRHDDMDAMCQEVVTQAGNLLHAEQTFLYILCDEPTKEEDNPSSSSVVPNPKGKYLHAKYSSTSTMDLQRSPSSTSKQADSFRHGKSEKQPFIPLGHRGIISRTALTREACNITNVSSTEPDYISSHNGVPLHKNADSVSDDGEEQAPAVKNILCVPVLDGNNHTIGVLQVINKVRDNEMDTKAANRRRGFTNVDVQILKALASHITVSLQRMMLETEDGAHDDEEKMRLRDTIRILKDSGLVPSQVAVIITHHDDADK